MVGLTGFEPVTLRLSSACSNQLSYRPNPNWLTVWLAEPKLSGQKPACVRSSELRRGSLRYRLRLKRRLVELRRFELLTYSLQSYRSTN